MFKSLNFKVILFGFIFTFFSSFGQSYFLGLFNSSIRDALSISHGQFGSIYASATLLSSFLLIWIGKKIDDVNVIKFAFFVVIFLSISSFFFSKINSVVYLFIAIFLMRLFGQGLMSHTASTTVSRFFDRSRGKALSTAWLGLSSAEFLLPILVVYLLTFLNWRDLWVYISFGIIIFLPLVSFFLVKNLKIDSREKSEDLKIKEKEIKQWRRSEVLKDYKFYIVSGNLLAMPWIFTGFAVFQSFILNSKNWGPYIIAQSFMAYSILSVISLSLAGFLIDKYSSRKLLIFMNIPIFFAVIVLIFFQSPISSFIFLGLMGMTNGFANVLGSATWAELYGVKYIGGIKAMTSALMVFSTAFGTAMFGFLIDKGFTIEEIASVSGFYIATMFILLFLIKNRLNPKYL
ncbi:MFS transporter [Candidatus Pelagibacter ubique]|nr:MFS transporter [Candidatus Pelagibacter bacterium]MDA7488502.1 MFS transporter [Candidatus Pelagibacter ubique]MDA8848732.1 MFS transporter [Candidatus Pelagibacter ubique]MDB9757702.1 MFS transporter [Candidatus Pelagibacter ubique]MDB9796801.1 MFS transporter [Candidatus Pelagibacter ubique]